MTKQTQINETAQQICEMFLACYITHGEQVGSRRICGEDEYRQKLALIVGKLTVLVDTLIDRDVVLLDAVQNEYLKIDPFAIPTGGGDADVGWIVSQYRVEQHEAIRVAVEWKDDVRQAIRYAIDELNVRKDGGG